MADEKKESNYFVIDKDGVVIGPKPSMEEIRQSLIDMKNTNTYEGLGDVQIVRSYGYFDKYLSGDSNYEEKNGKPLPDSFHNL